MKEAITDAANEVTQTQSKTPRKEWLDEKCMQHIKKRCKFKKAPTRKESKSRSIQENENRSQYPDQTEEKGMDV
jgi:hypothetical protein